MEKKNYFSRKIKNIYNNDYIFNGLLNNKEYDHQKGGSITVDLKKTQKELLKTLKNLSDYKPNIQPKVKQSFSELEKVLIELKNRINYVEDKSQVKTAEDKSFTKDLSNFDKFLNDIDGAKLDFGYSNDYKMNPLQKIDLKKIDKVNELFESLKKDLKFEERDEKINMEKIKSLKQQIDNILFTERDEKINLNRIIALKQELSDIQLNERDERIKMDKIAQIEIKLNDIQFKERDDKINLNRFQELKNPLEGINSFEERKDTINLNKLKELKLDYLLKDIQANPQVYEAQMKSSNDYLQGNYAKIVEDIKSIKKTIAFAKYFIEKINKQLIILKQEFIIPDLKTNVDKYVIIEKLEDFPEKEEYTGFDEPIPIQKANLTNKNINITNFEVPMDDTDDYFSPAFIDSIFLKVGGGSSQIKKGSSQIKKRTLQIQRGPLQIQKGGTLEDLMNISVEYSRLLNERHLLYKLKDLFGEYNVLYIQNYFYQLFILKNINKFSNNRKDTIYQAINKKTFNEFLQILEVLNKIIENPDDIFITNPMVKIVKDINSRRKTVHGIFYFKYYIVIKILYQFFKFISEKPWPEDAMINVFHHEINEASDIGLKNISKYLLLFNLVYPILLRYKEKFM
jgi:hypothetical protein